MAVLYFISYCFGHSSVKSRCMVQDEGRPTFYENFLILVQKPYFNIFKVDIACLILPHSFETIASKYLLRKFGPGICYFLSCGNAKIEYIGAYPQH